MKKASITEAKNRLSALLDEVRHGQTVLILDRGIPVARLEPVAGEEDLDGRLARLERQGILRRGLSHARQVLRKPLKTKKGASLLQAVLEERREGR